MTASKAQLESAMQTAWDAGCDPFEDPAVLTLLEAHPELLEAAAKWHHSVRSLQQLPLPTADASPSSRATTARPRMPWLAAGVVAAAAAFFLWPHETSRQPAQPERPTLRVLQSQLTQRVEHHGSACRVRETQYTTTTTAHEPGRLFLASRLVQRSQTSLTR